MQRSGNASLGADIHVPIKSEHTTVRTTLLLRLFTRFLVSASENGDKSSIVPMCGSVSK